MSVSSIDTILGWPRSEGCNWSRPTSIAKTRLAPFASNTSVKPPVEAPTSRQTRFSMSMGYCSSAPVSLTPPRETNGCAGCACNTASAAMASDAFNTGLSLAMTKPASIADLARAPAFEQSAFDQQQIGALAGRGLASGLPGQFQTRCAR